VVDLMPDSADRDRDIDAKTAEAWQHLREAKATRAVLHSQGKTARALGAFFHAEVVENGMNARWRAAMESRP
jgi:hypothetical protein